MPLFALDKMGIKPNEFFSNVVITGSHENAVLALAQGTVDVAANFWNAENDSNLTRMLNKHMVKDANGKELTKDDFRIVVKSPMIINSPIAYLSDLPDDLKAKIRDAFFNAAKNDKAAFEKLSDGKNQVWQPIDNEAYADTIKLIQFVDSLRKKG
jgi:phosphonate transport system substrate-binding protein